MIFTKIICTLIHLNTIYVKCKGKGHKSSSQSHEKNDVVVGVILSEGFLLYNMAYIVQC